MPELGRATYVVEIDTRKFDKDLKKVRARIESVSGDTTQDLKDIEKQSGKTSKSFTSDQDRMASSIQDTGNALSKTTTGMDANRRSVDRHSSSLARSDRAWSRTEGNIVSANAALGLLSKTFKLLKWPGIVAGLGLAVRALAQMTAGATALIGALGPLSGALVSAASAYSALGQAFLVFKIADFKNLTAAMKGSQAALKKLTPAARSFMEALKAMKPQWDGLKRAVQEKLFPGLEKALTAASQNMGVFQKVMVSTAGVIGKVATRFGEFLGSKGFGERFAKIGKTNNYLLGQFGKTALYLFDALTRVMTIAAPLTKWIAHSITLWARATDKQTKAGEASGRLATFFQHTKDAIKAVMGVLGPLWGGLKRIFTIGRGPGMTLWKEMGDAAQKFEDWTKSAEGSNAIKKYFVDMLPAMREIGRLARDITHTFFEIGNGQNISPLIQQIRTQMLPALAAFFTAASSRLGPLFIDIITQLVQMFTVLGGANGPLVLTLEVLDGFLRVLNKIIQLPLAGPIASWTLTFFGLAAVVKHLVHFFKGAALIQAIETVTGAWGASTAAIEGNTAALEGNRAAQALTSIRKPFKGTPAQGPVTQAGEKPAGSIPPMFPAGFVGTLAIAAAALGAIAAAVLAIKDNFLGLQDILKSVVQPFVDVFVSFGKQVDKISGGKLGEFFQTLGSIIGSVLGPVREMATWLFKLFGFIEVIGAAMGAFVLLGPILLPFILAIKAVTLGIQGLTTAVNTVKSAAVSLWNFLNGPLTAVWNSIKTVAMVYFTIMKYQFYILRGLFLLVFGVLKTVAVGAFNAIKGPAMWLFNNILKPIAQFVIGVLVNAFQTYKSVAISAFNAIKGPALFIFNNILKPVANFISGTLIKAFKSLSSGGGGAFDFIKDKAIKMWDLIKGIAGKIGGAFSDAWGTIKSTFSDVVEAIRGFINTIIGWINKLPGVPDIALIGGGSGTPANAPSSDANPSKGRKFPAGKKNQKTGGFLGTVPGTGSGDKVHLQAMVEPGEGLFVMNRNAMGGLAATNAAMPRRSLGGDIVSVGGDVVKGVANPGQTAVNVVSGAIQGKGLPGGLPGVGGLPDWIKGLGSYLLQSMAKFGVKAVADAAASFFGGGGTEGPQGVGSYMGVPMADWVIESLRYAAAHGSGNPHPTSGYRPGFDPNTATGASEHQGTQYPHGAVDFGSFTTGLAQKMAVVNASRTFKWPLLAPIGFSDDGHASGTGHRKGGVLGMAEGGILHDFARASADTHAPKRAVYALLMAGLAESGMRDLAGGDSSSEGTLQLLASTAQGYGISPHDEYGVAKGFLTHGYWGKGGGISLANQHMGAAMIAHMVQGNATGTGVYSAQASAAQRLLTQSGLRFPDNRATLGKAAAVPKTGTGQGAPPAGTGRAIMPKQYASAASILADADKFGAFAERSSTIGGAVFGSDQIGWLTKELAALFALRNLYVHIYWTLQARIAQIKKSLGDKNISAKQKTFFTARMGELKGARDALTGADGPLEQLQGPKSFTGGWALKPLTAWPPLGELGGRIFDVQSALLQAGGSSSTGSDINQAVAQGATARALVSELQYPVFKDFFAQQFEGGGIISGQAGSAQPVLGHAGEGVFTPDQMDAIGGSGSNNVEVLIDGDLITNKEFDQAIRVKVNGVLQDGISLARRKIG